jgi:hypothetical protein
MLTHSAGARQPARQPWSPERFRIERARALGFALDRSTRSVYRSHLESWLTFCDLHAFSYEPTEVTLCNFIVFMSHHIQPRSVATYLSGICNGLAVAFPAIREVRRLPSVSKTLQGCLRQLGSPPSRKLALTADHLLAFSRALSSPSHDDLLFLSLTFCGFLALHRLGELVDHHNPSLRSARKRILRTSVSCSSDILSYHLPAHKADRFFEGNVIVISRPASAPLDPFPIFRAYLRSRDHRDRFSPFLWLDSRGAVPTRSWYLARLHALLPHTFGGHSLRSGGATFFASHGWSYDRIQTLGRWASDAFRVYIRKHPALLHVLIPPAPPPLS